MATKKTARTKPKKKAITAKKAPATKTPVKSATKKVVIAKQPAKSKSSPNKNAAASGAKKIAKAAARGNAGKTAAKKKATVKAAPKKAAPRKAATKKAAPKKAAPKKAASKPVAKKTPAIKASAKKAVAKKAAPAKTPKKAAPGKAAPKALTSTRSPASRPVKKTPAKASAPKASKPAVQTGTKDAGTTKGATRKNAPATSRTTASNNPDMSTRAVDSTPNKAERGKGAAAAKVRAEAMKQPISKLDADAKGFVPYQMKKGEEYMNEQQKDHFKSILLNWRNELMQEVDRTVHHMQDEAANPPDPADRATLEEEFSIELRTRDRERRLIKKIDSTIELIANDDYGYCDSCGVEIGIRRLEARPTANKCIDCKTLDEIKERQLGSA